MSMLAVICSACSDGEDIKNTTNLGVACEGQARECSSDADNVYNLCTNGFWVSHTCKEGKCKDGHCVVSECDSTINLPSEASEAEKVKFGLTADRAAVKVCEDGKYTVKACERGQIVVSDETSGVAYCENYNKVCDEGTRRCSIDGVPQLCKNNNWENQEECDANARMVCQGGKCVKDAECTEGSFKCDDKDPKVKYTCVEGSWSKEDCDADLVCKSAAKDCVDVSGLPVVGSQCDVDAFNPVCKYGEFYGCDEGKVFMDPCDNGLACVVRDGQDACMYTNSDLGNACKYDGQLLTNLFTTAYACGLAKLGLMRVMECAEIDGALYGDAKVITGVCVDSNTKISCSKETKQYVTSSCDNDCHIVEDGFSVTEAGETYKFDDAVCTVTSSSEIKVGDPCNTSTFEPFCAQDNTVAMTCPGGSVYAKECSADKACKNGECVDKNTVPVCPVDGYEVCDDACTMVSGGTCFDFCKGKTGSNFCCTDDRNVYCKDPNGPLDDTLWDCSSEKLKNGQTVSEYCNESRPGSTVGLCADCSDYFYCLTPEQAADAVDKSGSEVFGKDICADEDDDTFYDCSDETLKGGTTLSAACEAEEPGHSVALCASCNTEDFWCYEDDSNVGKSASEITGMDVCKGTSATCDLYDCSDDYLSECPSGSDAALCDKDYFYCRTRKASEDASCDEGKTAYEFTDDSGAKEVECILVGEDISCLGGSEPSYKTCDQIDVEFAAQGGCALQNGQTCKEYCADKGSDICYVNTSNYQIVCEDPYAGSCDLYDCTANVDMSQCPAGLNVALCEAGGGYCAKRNEAADSTCKDGAVAYDFQVDAAGNTEVDCVIVGADASCLNGSDDIVLCSDMEGCQMQEGGLTCQEYCKSQGSDYCAVDRKTNMVLCTDPSTVNDVFYDCRNEPYNATQTMSEYCVAKHGADNSMAVCNECTTTFWCFTAEQAASFVGKTATELGVASKVCQ